MVFKCISCCQGRGNETMEWMSGNLGKASKWERENRCMCQGEPKNCISTYDCCWQGREGTSILFPDAKHHSLLKLNRVWQVCSDLQSKKRFHTCKLCGYWGVINVLIMSHNSCYQFPPLNSITLLN